MVTNIPNGATSRAKDSENPSTANLLEQYSDAKLGAAHAGY
jgi:hypothetical protein